MLKSTMKDSDLDKDEPKNSSAAACLNFSLLEHTFQVEYTHQCFPGEYIPGYRPRRLCAQRAVHDAPSKHASFQCAASHELSVSVRLSPTCANCTISTETWPIKRGPMQSPYEQISSNKRVKVQKDDDKSVELGSEDSDSDEEDEDIDATILSAQGTVADGVAESQMKEDEIQTKLQQFLPPVCKIDDPLMENFLTKPMGTVVTEYSRKGCDFILSLCNGIDCTSYHGAVQKVAAFFIESADDVDIAEGEDAWKVMYVFQKHGTAKFSLAGYMTLFHFDSPFRKPIAGTVVRVCQVIVLPPYQRSGHGKKMLRTVFDLSCDETDSGLPTTLKHIVEINVEDPAPAFATLRIAVDYERFARDDRSWFNKLNQKDSITEANYFSSLKDSEATTIASEVKTTSKQVQMVYEMEKLHALQSHFDKNPDQNRDLLEKSFRLMVKRRLHRQCKEDVSACQGKEEVQRLLGRMFEGSYQQYRALLKQR